METITEKSWKNSTEITPEIPFTFHELPWFSSVDKNEWSAIENIWICNRLISLKQIKSIEIRKIISKEINHLVTCHLKK